MMRLAPAVVLACILSACMHTYTHEPGGPYYFGTFVTNFQEPLTPRGELTEAAAQAHTASGAAIYLVWFNAQGRPARVEKYHRGARLMQVNYTYQNGKLSEAREVDDSGKLTVRTY